MSYIVPIGEPEKVFAGVRLRWKRDVANHPPDAWTLTYYLRKQNSNDNPITVAATADGTLHNVDVAASTTTNWPEGKYYWVAYVVKTATPTEKYQVDDGWIEIVPDFAGVLTPYDARTDAQTILDAHIQCYKDRAGRPEQSYNFGTVGRSFNYKTDQQMIDAIRFWQGEVAKEQAKIDGGSKRNIYIRFGNPT